jgi:hypothetical protein
LLSVGSSTERDSLSGWDRSEGWTSVYTHFACMVGNPTLRSNGGGTRRGAVPSNFHHQSDIPHPHSGSSWGDRSGVVHGHKNLLFDGQIGVEATSSREAYQCEKE